MVLLSAFQSVSAAHLQGDHRIDCDVLVAGDGLAVRQSVIELVEAAGMRGIHAGPLANSVALEALTPVLIHINRSYKVSGASPKLIALTKSNTITGHDP